MVDCVICEKEDAGEQIARYLQCEKSEGYWTNEKYIVVSARGHLLDMWLKGLTVHSIGELPATEVYYRILKQDKPKMALIKSLSKQCDSVIVATDFDREGEVIGYNIVKHIWKIEDPNKISRVYFNALTDSELKRAFDNLGAMDETLLTQGLARNLADVITGLNLTKALTLLFKEKYSQLTQAISIGRVQSPLLSAITRSVGMSYREEADTFTDDTTSTKTYLVTENEDVEVPISTESETVELVDYEEEEKEIEQAQPFPSTSEVQAELPFSPEISMNICESLYLKGFATYPRTKSHFLPDEVVDELEAKMKEHNFMAESFSSEYAKIPTEESKLPHWAITLTTKGIDALAQKVIKGREKIVADYLTVKIARAMAPPLSVTVLYAIFTVDGERQSVKWSEECENLEDCILPNETFSGKPKVETGTYEIKRIRTQKHDAMVLIEAYKPSFNVFSNKDLVAWMEKEGLGTEATRHTFPVVLRSRNYIDKENLPNQFGEVVASIIDSLGLSSDLTADMEKRIEALTKMKDLQVFRAWILGTTRTLLDKLDTIDNAREIIDFRCPNDHEAILINTRHGLFLRCETCKKFYSL